MEYFRKQAKALARDFRAGERKALARAERVLGERAGERFLLADAQHVISREQGHRSWAALVRASRPNDDAEVSETTVEPGAAYGDGEAVAIRIRRRGRRFRLDDGGRAVAKAGRHPGWLEVATEVAEAFSLNVNRRGVVFVPAVEGGLDRAWLARRVADCSVAVHDALVELDPD
jgi:hypothetical protein